MKWKTYFWKTFVRDGPKWRLHQPKQGFSAADLLGKAGGETQNKKGTIFIADIWLTFMCTWQWLCPTVQYIHAHVRQMCVETSSRRWNNLTQGATADPREHVYLAACKWPSVNKCGGCKQLPFSCHCPIYSLFSCSLHRVYDTKESYMAQKKNYNALLFRIWVFWTRHRLCKRRIMVVFFYAIMPFPKFSILQSSHVPILIRF